MSVSNITYPLQSQKTIDFKVKYKTERCRFWYERGFCPFKQFCAFAHNEEQIRDKSLLNMKYKTKLCYNFFDNGFCKYGDRCQYLHKSFDQKDGQKTRSQSEQSYSSRDSGSQREKSRNSNRYESKHRARFEMLKEKDFTMFEMQQYEQFRMMGSHSLFGRLMSQEQAYQNQIDIGFYEVEYYSGLGNNEYYEQKKSRLYSL